MHGLRKKPQPGQLMICRDGRTMEVGAGADYYVTLSTAQTISGAKTFSASVAIGISSDPFSRSPAISLGISNAAGNSGLYVNAHTGFVAETIWGVAGTRYGQLACNSASFVISGFNGVGVSLGYSGTAYWTVGTTGNLTGDAAVRLIVNNPTASTSTTTGAFVVTGGAGIGGTLNATTVTAADTLNALGTTSTAIISAGGDAIAADKTFDFNTAAGNNRFFRWLSGGVARWGIGANSSAETGADAGCRLVVRAFSDAGSSLGDVITIFRAAGGSILITRPVSNTETIISTGTTAGVGYGTGAGGTVTQITSKATGVTLNKVCGQITMNNAALGAGAKVSFVVTNSACAATDIPRVVVVSGGTANAYRADVTAVGAGSFTVTVENITAGSLSEAPVIGFDIGKAVTA